jgi:hypothetical protein
MTNRMVIPRAARSAAYRYHPGHIAGDGNASERSERHDHRAHHHSDDGGRA